MTSIVFCFLAFFSVASVGGFVAPQSAARTRNSPVPTWIAASLEEASSMATNNGGSDNYSKFQGHTVYSSVFKGKANKPAVILVHGFGCSSLYWRETIRSLQKEGYTVHAIDLLGQGKSDKPGRNMGIEYSINLWAEQVDEYARNQVKSSEIYLMGNSLGSVVALNAATGDFMSDKTTSTAAATTTAANAGSSYLRARVKGIGMFNCGIGMNSRNILLDYTGIQKAILTAIFDLFEALIFANVPLLTYILDKVVTKELLKNALTGLYLCAEDPSERVDDALVDSFYYPAKDPGSPETLSQIYTNDPGKTPMALYQDRADFLQSQVPIHLVWGEKDSVTPLQGPVGKFFQQLAKDSESNVSFDIINGGHIPFDEVPACNELMLEWLNSQVPARQKGGSTGMPVFGDFKLPFLSR